MASRSMSVLFQPLSLRSDLDWLTSLSLMVEAIHITSAAGQPEPALYTKVRDAIVMLDAGAVENAALNLARYLGVWWANDPGAVL